MASKLTLYTYFRSSCAWRVRIALAYKGLEYESKAVNLIATNGGDQLQDEYKRSVNPMGQVPALVVEGVGTLTQSLSILEYLDEAYPKKPLLPTDSFKKSQVRSICELIAGGIQPIQNLSVIRKVSDKSEVQAEWAKYWIDKGFQALEQVLEETAGTCCVGDNVTLGDCCLVPQVGNAIRFKVDMEKFPTINRINDHLLKLPAFQQAHPFAQEDCPENLRVKSV